jgi:hypothetical protein
MRVDVREEIKGRHKVKQSPAEADAATVLIIGGKSMSSRRARQPAFAAVSPNLERGPWMRAGPTPE